jgi:hypothetical protein
MKATINKELHAAMRRRQSPVRRIAPVIGRYAPISAGSTLPFPQALRSHFRRLYAPISAVMHQSVLRPASLHHVSLPNSGELTQRGGACGRHIASTVITRNKQLLRLT